MIFFIGALGAFLGFVSLLGGFFSLFDGPQRLFGIDLRPFELFIVAAVFGAISVAAFHYHSCH